MDIIDLLAPEAVFELREADKARVLKALAARAGKLLQIDAEPIAQALLRREDLGSTGLGAGVALPHAQIATLARPCGLFARLKPAAAFDAIDERPVDLVFVLLLPEQPPQHQLKAMASVARRLRDPVLAGRLRSAPTASLHALLTAP